VFETIAEISLKSYIRLVDRIVLQVIKMRHRII